MLAGSILAMALVGRVNKIFAFRTEMRDNIAAVLREQ